MFKKMSTFASVSMACLGLTACATGDSLSQSAASIPEVAQGMSRIVVYRTQIMGAAVQPKIFVNGQETDTCQPNQVFYVDVPAGQHVLKAVTETTETLVVNTQPNTSTYVTCEVDFGIVIGRPDLEIEHSATGRGEVNRLVFGGLYKVE